MPCLRYRFLHSSVTLCTRRYSILVYSVLKRLLAMPCLRHRFLHSPVTLCTRRYCILVYSVLGEVISYAQLCPGIPGLGDRFQHSLMTLRTSDIVSWFVQSWERLLAMLMPVEPVPALTSHLVDLSILFPVLKDSKCLNWW